MDWETRLQVLRWRAVEEADEQRILLQESQREEATRHAMQSGGEFHASRADWLRLHAGVPGSRVWEIFEELRPRSPGVLAATGWCIAFAAGYALTELGHDRMINVIAAPFMGLLLWNIAIIALSLIMEWRASATHHGLPAWIVNHLLPARRSDDDDVSRAGRRFHALASPCLSARAAARARAWLHLGAALFALGTITGMYAKGWSREYRAVWESTLLSREHAERFVSALYKPASVMFGVRVPVEQMATMRIGPGQPDPQPADALPWIHLFAGTLALLVLAPRLALTCLAVWRGDQRVRREWDSMNWPMLEARQRSAVSGTGLEVDVLMHGWRAGEEPRDRWAEALRERFGALALLQYQAVPDDEESFARDWRTRAAHVVVVFNAAATPEQEVQPVLLRDLRSNLAGQGPAAHLLALLDATTLRDRRSAEAVNQRLDLWRTMLRGAVEDVLVA